MKTWQFYFEGVIEVEAETEDSAIQHAFDAMTTADIGYWKIEESDPDHAGVR